MVSTVSPKGEAHLLVYQLKFFSASHEYSSSLNKTLKRFTSKPITQVGGAWVGAWWKCGVWLCVAGIYITCCS